MRLLAPAFKFHFKEGRRTMILSVLSSPALVSGLMVVRAKNPVHSVLFPILVFCDTSGLLILLGLDFSAMIFPVVHIGAIAVSFLSLDSNSRRSISPFGHRSCYIFFYLYLPKQISRILFGLSFYFLTVKLFLLLLNSYPLFAPEALVFASSYSGASAPACAIMLFGHDDDDLSRAVAPFLPRGGGAPVTLPEERPLTMEEEDRLALVLDYQNKIGALLKSLDISWLWGHHFDKESNEDLAAATLLHKDAELNDPDKLWVVHEGLMRNKHSSRYYFRAIDWVRTERKVRNGELPITFIIDDDQDN
jgi:hypothetical protein